MTDADRHFDEELQDAVDDRLPSAERTALAAHLAECRRCRTRFELLTAAKEAAARLRVDEMPAAVPARILEAIRQEPPPNPERRGATVARRPWAWGVATAAVVALAVGVMWSVRGPETPPALVASDYTAYRDGRLPLEMHSTDVAEVEAYFRRVGIPFPTRVFDLAMMHFTVEGGRVHRLSQTTSALFVYRGRDGAVLVCQMYPGRATDLPAPRARRTQNDIDFLIYEERGVTLVFWQEGEVVCVLAGEGDTEEIIQLAFAKAVKV